VRQNKLDRLPLPSFYQACLIFESKARADPSVAPCNFFLDLLDLLENLAKANGLAYFETASVTKKKVL
jgi:hypothetical protein